MTIRLTPISILSVTVLFGLIFAVMITLMAQQQPWIGIKLQPSDNAIVVEHTTGPSAAIPKGTILLKIASSKEEVHLSPSDLITEPDGTIDDYDVYRDFLSRQGRISGILASEVVTFTSDNGEEFSVIPKQSRPLTSLPVSFWVQLTVGLFAWFISSAVFAFRSQETSARYLLLSGAATLTFAPFAAVYSTRELALPEMLFQWLCDGNFLGGSIFTASFFALLLYYPRRIAPAWLGPAIIATFVVWFILQQNDVFNSMIFARRFLVTVGISSTFILAAVHWFLTKKDPVARAALQWFLLSWMLGTCLFWLFILLPQMFGVDISGLQGYAFTLFLLVYGGLAFGILRYRLFDLGAWWGKIIIWSLTILMLVLFDFLFLLVLQLSSELSLSLALLLSGLLWLPLRSFVWSRFFNRPAVSRDALFEQVINIAFTKLGADLNSGWQRLLQNVFNPLHIHTSPETPECKIDNNGLGLLLPSIGSISALSLEYCQAGHKLFTSQDIAQAKELVTMLRHTIESRTAYEKGVTEERQRIARDMHDNIGAQLLGALHNQDNKRKDNMIRESLSDLRDIINDTSHLGLSFDETLANLRVETAERLSDANITLDWKINANDAPPLTPQVTHGMRSIIREGISNIIKHAHAKTTNIHIQYQNGNVSILIMDDGKNSDPTSIQWGNGLTNMQARITHLSGSLQFLEGKKGLSLRIEFPLNAESGTP